MEKVTYTVVHRGIPISVEKTLTPGKPTEAEITLHGPRKMWNFEIFTFAEKQSQGNMLTKRHSAPKIPGETTALAEVGMRELALYAHDANTSFRYVFKTEDTNLRKWFTKRFRRGKRALGITQPHIDQLGRIIAGRTFTPDTIYEPPQRARRFVQAIWETMNTSLSQLRKKQT